MSWAPNNFQYVAVGTDNSQPISWSQVEVWIAPSYLQLPEWAAASALLQQWIGGTWGGFVRLLDQNASLIVPATGDPSEVGGVLDLAVQKAIAAVGSSISGSLQAASLSIPISGTTVYAVNTATQAVTSTQSLNDGSFIFPTLSPGTYQLSVDGAVVTSNSSVTVAAGQAVTGVTLDLSAGATISGQVFGQPSNLPIAGAALLAVNEADSSEFPATSDAQGNFSFTGLPPGVYDLIVNAAGYARTIAAGVDVSTANAVQTITMSPEAVLSGSVTLGSGGATASALTVTVEPVGNTDPNQIYSVTTSLLSFQVVVLPAGEYDVTFSMSGYLAQTLTGVNVAAGAQVNLSAVTLAPPATVSGTLEATDPSLSVAGVLITAQIGGTVAASAYTDDLGNYTLANLAPGTYAISALPPAGFSDNENLVVNAGDNDNQVDLNLHPGGIIQGTVTATGSGAVLPGVVVTLSGPTGQPQLTSTDAQGVYSFSNLGLGTYTVFLTLPATTNSQAATVSNLDAGTTTANFSVPFAYDTALQGNVQDSVGDPLANAEVSLIQNGTAVATTSTSADGSYSFVLAQGGTFDLQVDAASAGGEYISGITVATHAVVNQPIVAGTASVTIDVADAGGPLAGTVVQFYRQVSTGLAIAGTQSTDSTGQAIFSDLTPGTYSVLASSEPESALGSLTVSSGSNPAFTLNLTATYTLSGTITDGSANPIAGATVYLASATSSLLSRAAVTAQDGSYTIVNVAPGTYDVVVSAAGFDTDVQTAVSVTADQTQNVSLVASTTTIQGVAEDTAGNAIPLAAVSVHDASGHILGMATADANGAFQLEGIVGTGLTLTVAENGYASQTLTNLTFAAGNTINVGTVQLPFVAFGQQVTGIDSPGYSPLASPDVKFSASPVVTPLGNPPSPATPAIGDQSFGATIINAALAALSANVTARNVEGPQCSYSSDAYFAFLTAEQAQVNFYNNVVKPAAQQLLDSGTHLIAADYAETAILAAQLAAAELSFLPYSLATSGFVTAAVYTSVQGLFSFVQAIDSYITNVNAAQNATEINANALATGKAVWNFKSAVQALFDTIKGESDPPKWFGPIVSAVMLLISDPYALTHAPGETRPRPTTTTSRTRWLAI